ncbi:TPA: cysteine--tRNA ligase, partial [Campylobacter lari]|nr:cysteine--tRNA ligase [Campylobacter lari]
MVFFDSVLKKKCEFIPHEAKKANIYLCGPTVYDDAHLGHARSSVCFDFLRRVLLANDYEVVFARNYTDIDDKILKKMQE